MNNQIVNKENTVLNNGVYFGEEVYLIDGVYFDDEVCLVNGVYFDEEEENSETAVSSSIQSQPDNCNERQSIKEKVINIGDLELSNIQNLYRGVDYITDNNSLNIITKNTVTKEDEVIEISNFIIKPLAIIIEDDGVDKETVYKIKCILMDTLESHIITLKPEQLNNSKWIKDVLGVKYYVTGNVDEYKKLEIFIAKEFKLIQAQVEYKMIGWRNIKGKWVYLHGGGAIGLGFDEDICGSKDKRIDHIDISQYDAINQSIGLLSISNDLSKTLPMFLFSHLAVIKELFVQASIKPQFCLWIYGLTGSMKTSVSKVFFNIFSNKENIAATFKDTIAAIEMKSFDYKDSVLLVDDFHPTTSTKEKNEMRTLASEILRRYGDGICKSRATKNMTKQREYMSRGLCAITGEDVMSGESTVARYVSIEVKPGDFKSEELSYFQNNPCIFSTHIYYFIEWVSNNFIALKEYIKEQVIKVRNENLGNFRHARMSEAFAIFSVIIDIFLSYSIQYSFVSEYEKENISVNWKMVMFDIIKTHENSNIQQSPIIMYLTAIKDLVASGKLYLIDITADKLRKNKENINGYESEEKIFLISKLAYAEVRSFWRNQGIEFPVSEEIINKMLDQNEVIEVKVEGNTRRRTLKISGDSRRFLAIKKEKMEAILEQVD